MHISSEIKSHIFIGLMSGTSIDAIDAVAVSFDQQGMTLLETHSHPIAPLLKTQILALQTPSENELHKTLHLDQILGELFAEAAMTLLEKAKLQAEQITAIGSHGQTIRHQVSTKPFYSLQIGNPHIIAERTGICTIADFRTRDIAIGGQGAPLAPAFHQAMFQSDNDRIILNIGGMANATLLNKDGTIQGFDTGPGNVLLDMWIQDQKGLSYDQDGKWARSGEVNTHLLAQLLSEGFFQRSPPKSTGRDLFNETWLTEKLNGANYTPEDVQASLLELTSTSIANAIKQWGPTSAEIYLCGGGAYNQQLVNSLKNQLSEHCIDTTQKLGLDPNWVEACAFAWLSQQTLANRPNNLPSVTGAKKPTVLGGIYTPSPKS